MIPYIAPLIVFGLVVFVHELGHFLAAKLTGVYAPVFSLGWGRRLFGWRHGETDYRVSVVPLGGYVRMATREDDAMAGIEGGTDRGPLGGDEGRPAGVPPSLWSPDAMAPFGPHPVPAHRWVESKSVGARVFILSAGVLMNVLLTLGVSSAVYLRYGNAYRPPVVDSVKAGGPADRAGMRAGDLVVRIDGDSVRAWDEVVSRISAVTSGTLAIEVVRGTGVVALSVPPELAEVTDPTTGTIRRVGRIGMAVRDTVAHEAVGAARALQLGASATWAMASGVGGILKGLVMGSVSAKNLGGPIQIARTSVQAARRGPETLWSLIAFLSINIAMLNLVPIPVLDGGQILLVLVEAAKGSALSPVWREWLARIGVAAVLALILLVTYNDIRATFGL